MDLASTTPRAICLDWQPLLLWLHAVADGLIAVACVSIAAVLVVLALRPRMIFRQQFGLAAAFVLACGLTHAGATVMLWYPFAWPEGALKALAAALAITAAATAWPMLPQALAIPSRQELRALNARLADQVAERDLAALRLNDSRQRLRRLYARTPAPLYATDRNGIVQDVSDRWLDLFGYQRQQVVGQHINQFYVPEPDSAATDHLADLRDGRGTRQVERRMRRGDGELRDVEATYELERDDCGRVERILVALHDITPRKEAEAALGASEDRLRQSQKMEAVGQLTGGIAHDFNNLLTTIMGSLEMLARQQGLDARGQRLTGNALEGAERAARLTSQLLSFSRRQQLSPEPLVPSDAVASIRDLLCRTAGEQVQLELPAPHPAQWPVLADRNQLEVTLVNLVINARDAIMRDGSGEGRIEIRFANYTFGQADADALTPENIAPGDFVGITVADTGHGMAPEVLAHAFEPFFTTKAPGAGTGLGLSQTYGFATQSGGAVRIDSEPGLGTTVEVLLPRAAVAPASRIEKARAADVAGHGEVVMVVEDDALLRQTLTEGLRQRGFQVLEAADGRSALAMLSRGVAVDFLFTDVMMPGGLNGVAVARAARGLRADLKIMFATGYSDHGVLAEWPEPLDMLQKPYSLQAVATRIAARLRETAPV